MRFSIGLAVVVAWLCFGACVRADDAPESFAYFEKRIRPLLVKHCYECHSAGAKKIKGALRLDTREMLWAGGQSGPVVVAGTPDKSTLITLVKHADAERRMPPKKQLAAEEIAALEAWIKSGAPFPATAKATSVDTQGLWSLQPVIEPKLPALPSLSYGQAPIDRFIRSALEKKGINPAPRADQRTLIRRVTFDLTGLPPTPTEIDDFLKDDSPAAFRRVVDRLLATPAYGERWGRHWLDVVRYADSAGDNSDYPIPQIFRYRNWVIDAVNRDLSYDEFVRQQLAGDLLAARDERDRHEKLIATGYLANSRRFGSYEEARYPWYLTVEDTIDNLGRTFLGLTINCCRCHDHKFDPLTQHDYYALYGFFSSTRYPRPGIELDKVQRDFVPLAPADKVATAEKERRDLTAGLSARIKVHEKEKAAADQALKDAEKNPDGDDKKAKIAQAAKLSKDLYNLIKKLNEEKQAIERNPLPFELAYAVTEGKTEGKRKVGNVCVHIKGDPERLGPEVPRRFPSALGGQTLPADVTGSGRLQLADWIVDPKNPLTARVMVNRIWQYHFGQGLAATPSDFGKQGQPPTHPELLDWLALRFIESGWSIKAMHRLIVLSETYQQTSRIDDLQIPAVELQRVQALDPDNTLLWRFNSRRLDAESIRDSILAVSGALDRTPGGAHPFPDMKKWDFTQHNPFKANYETNKRSVYLMTQRIQRHPFLALFDGADTNASTATRTTSTTPLQALFIMNDPFVHTQAAKFAERVRTSSTDVERRIDLAFTLLYGRSASADERATLTKYLSQAEERFGQPGLTSEERTAKAWDSLARALLQSNEFVYVD